MEKKNKCPECGSGKFSDKETQLLHVLDCTDCGYWKASTKNKDVETNPEQTAHNLVDIYKHI